MPNKKNRVLGAEADSSDSEGVQNQLHPSSAEEKVLSPFATIAVSPTIASIQMGIYSAEKAAGGALPSLARTPEIRTSASRQMTSPADADIYGDDEFPTQHPAPVSAAHSSSADSRADLQKMYGDTETASNPAGYAHVSRSGDSSHQSSESKNGEHYKSLIRHSSTGSDGANDLTSSSKRESTIVPYIGPKSSGTTQLITAELEQMVPTIETFFDLMHPDRENHLFDAKKGYAIVFSNDSEAEAFNKAHKDIVKDIVFSNKKTSAFPTPAQGSASAPVQPTQPSEKPGSRRPSLDTGHWL